MIRGLDIWGPEYLKQALQPRPAPRRKPVSILLAVGDHFEPYWGQPDEATALARVAAWEEGLPALADGLADARGRPPQHDFFYPLEDYRPEILERLKALCDRGLGAVEVHLHHEGETPEELESLLLEYAEKLHREHGLLRRDPATGRVLYGFIHGNWALDNSRPDGRWCGVNNELQILARTGCYADFTLPSAPSDTQTTTINSIYYATDDPTRPKSHDRGRPAAVGLGPTGDLLMVQGVLTLDWSRRKWGLLPSLENSDLAGHFPPSPHRADLWVRFAPTVRGAEEVRFLKLSCHGAPEKNQSAVLGRHMRNLLEYMIDRYNDGEEYRLLFVTCWEMVQAIHALERGEELPW